MTLEIGQPSGIFPHFAHWYFLFLFVFVFKTDHVLWNFLSERLVTCQITLNESHFLSNGIFHVKNACSANVTIERASHLSAVAFSCEKLPHLNVRSLVCLIIHFYCQDTRRRVETQALSFVVRFPESRDVKDAFFGHARAPLFSVAKMWREKCNMRSAA